MKKSYSSSDWFDSIKKALPSLRDDPILGSELINQLQSSVPFEIIKNRRHVVPECKDLMDVLSSHAGLHSRNYLITEVLYAYWAPAYFALVDVLKAFFKAEMKISIKDLPEYAELEAANKRVNRTCKILNYQAILPPEFFEMGY